MKIEYGHEPLILPASCFSLVPVHESSPQASSRTISLQKCVSKGIIPICSETKTSTNLTNNELPLFFFQLSHHT